MSLTKPLNGNNVIPRNSFSIAGKKWVALVLSSDIVSLHIIKILSFFEFSRTTVQQILCILHRGDMNWTQFELLIHKTRPISPLMRPAVCCPIVFGLKLTVLTEPPRYMKNIRGPCVCCHQMPLLQRVVMWDCVGDTLLYPVIFLKLLIAAITSTTVLAEQTFYPSL